MEQRRQLHCALMLIFVTASVTFATDSKSGHTTSVRWQENRPGCTYSRMVDGKYRYGLSWRDVAVSLAVDPDELQKASRRQEPFLGVHLSVRYQGSGTLNVDGGAATLEFVKHLQVRQPPIAPDDFVRTLQGDAHEAARQAAQEIEKHPDEREPREAYARAIQKNAAELITFVSKNALRKTVLNPANPEVSGWILFRANSEQISGWEQQESFIFRLALADTVFEIPFNLPPSIGDLLLRRRQ